MSQNVNLTLAGLYLSGSDYEGLPPGSLTTADNVEIRYKNLVEPRRGFDSLTNSAFPSNPILRLINFVCTSEQSDLLFSLVSTSGGQKIYFYNPNTQAWQLPLGTSLVSPPDPTYAKTRFVNAGTNLYATSNDGVRSISSSSGGVESLTVLRAGVPKGLDLLMSVPGNGVMPDRLVTSSLCHVYNGTNVLFLGAANPLIQVGQFVSFPFSGHNFDSGTTVTNIIPSAPVITQTGTTTASSVTVTGVASITGIINGASAVTGSGIQAGTLVLNNTGGGPYTLTLSLPATASGTPSLVFYSPTTVITSSVIHFDPVPSTISTAYFYSNTSGWLNNNVILSRQVRANASSTTVTTVDTTGIIVGQYFYMSPLRAFGQIIPMSFSGRTPGTAGNGIVVTFVNGASPAISVNSLNITVTIISGTTTVTNVVNLITGNTVANNLIILGPTINPDTSLVTTGSTTLSGGGEVTATPTQVTAVSPSVTGVIQTGNTALFATQITNLASTSGLSTGMIVSGPGISVGTTVVSISGTGPYTVGITGNTFQAVTGGSFTFSQLGVITLSQATQKDTIGIASFYSGAQVGYRAVYGRVDTTASNKITRLGSPTSIAIAMNTTGSSQNVTASLTLPRDTSGIQFVQLYRSSQTAGADITPLDQYRLTKEYFITGSDITNRTITILDDTPDSPALLGAALYCGADQEGILQSNDPPPLSFDMCLFNDFALYFNVNYPSTLQISLLGIGSPNGLQLGDTLTVAGTGEGSAPVFSRVYTAGSSEIPASRTFQLVTSGTPGQNLANTALSLVRVINYDLSNPIHAIYASTDADISGQIRLEADQPWKGRFTVTASRTSAFSPLLASKESTINYYPNSCAYSKSGRLEAVPFANSVPVGNNLSTLYRGLALRDYVLVLSSLGIYKIIGTSTQNLSVIPFDFTTQIVGPDTAVVLNSAVWMLSNQGVVSISDAGVDVRSIPVDNAFFPILGSYLTNVITNAFAIGYENDRKYILALPTTTQSYSNIQYGFNYLTSAWTTWSRNFYSGFVHSNQKKLYMSCADPDNTGVSLERKSYTFRDFADEPIPVTITHVDGVTLTLGTVNSLHVGDLLYQTQDPSPVFAPILSIQVSARTVTTQFVTNYVTGSAQVLKAYTCQVTWKQIVADNPAFTRVYPEGIALFKNTRFQTATMRFLSDNSLSNSDVSIQGSGAGSWGQFSWGGAPWGGVMYPSSCRFFVPGEKQFGSYLIPSFIIHSAFSDFKLQGLVIQYSSESPEVGR